MAPRPIPGCRLHKASGQAIVKLGGKDREGVAKLDTLARQLVKYIGPQGKAEDRQPLALRYALLCHLLWLFSV
ncbi:MAG: hypothetical protein WD063_10265 [Pirellulales bacterium]